MNRFAELAPPHPSESEFPLGRAVPDAHTPAADASQESPSNALTKSARRARKAAAPRGQGREGSAIPQFPTWGRIDAGRRSEGRTRRGADAGREEEGFVEARSIEARDAADALFQGHGAPGSRRPPEAGNAAARRPEEGAAGPMRRADPFLAPVTGLGQPGEGRGLSDSLGHDARSGAPGALDAAFLAGAGLAALDPLLRTEAPWRGCWGARLALEAAAASARLLGRAEDETALRDAFTLRRPGDDPGPAGRLLVAWRSLAGRRPDLVLGAETAEKIARDLGLTPDARLGTIVEAAEALTQSDRPAVFAAAETAARVSTSLEHIRDREKEILAYLLADAVLAVKLRWPVVVPLLAGAALHPSLRKGPQGKRTRPGDPDWAEACCLAYARAAEAAHDRARDLARRAEKLEAALPKLRAKGAEAAVAKILEEDAVSASMRPGHLSERAARRMFDRLVSFGVLREITGRPTFRLYGL